MKKKLVSILLVGAFAAALLSGCGNTTETGSTSGEKNLSATTDTAAKETSYKYGHVQIPCLDGALCGAPLYIAYENGYFAEEGIDAELIAADTETRKIGLNNGDYPITNGDFMFFQSIEQDVNVSVVDGLHNGCIKVLVPAGSDIKSAEDLKGKKIGVDEIGGPPYEATSIWLEDAGIKASGADADVTFLPYSDGNLELEALYNGEIAAAAIWDPIASEATQSGKAESILDIGKDGIFAGKYCCFVYASDKVLEEQPDEIAALLRAIRKAEQWINDHPDETVKIIADKGYSEIEDATLASQLLQEYVYPTQEELDAGERNVKDTVEYFAEKLYDVGYLSTPPEELMNKLYTEVDVKQ